MRFATNDPITGPNPGPKKGVRINSADAGPLVLGGNVSEMEPDARARDGPQENPVIKRKKHNPPRLWTKPHPSVKRVLSGRIVA